MPTRRDVVVNPFVSEYLYDTIINATVEQRRFLNGKYLKVGRNKRKARAFSVNSTLEEKALMFTKLGIPFAWVFNLDRTQLKQFQEESDGYSNVQLTDKMLQARCFVVTDKQFMLFSNLMASNSHSETWMLNRAFHQAAYRIKEWRQAYGNVPLEDAKVSLPAGRDMAKVMLNAIIFSKYAEGLFEINETEIAVLLYIFSKEKEFIPLEELRNHFNGIYRNFKLVRCLNSLLKAQYVEKGMGKWVKDYRITSWGIDTALKFEKRVFALENF